MMLGDVWTITRRELLRYQSERLFLLAQVLLPLLAILVVGFGVGGSVGNGLDYTSFLGSGVLMLLVASGALGGGYTLIEDVQRGFLRPILVAPVSRTSIVLGKAIARLLLSGLLAAVLITLLAFFTRIGIHAPLTVVATLIAVTFGFVSMGILLASSLRTVESFRTLATLLTFPVYLVSGMFLPIATMPAPLKALALANPFSYAVDLFRYGTTGLAELPLWLDALVVLAIAVVPTALAIRVFETRLTD
ncbi:MAG: ABC transporter permease [Myxococcota bacterium]